MIKNTFYISCIVATALFFIGLLIMGLPLALSVH